MDRFLKLLALTVTLLAGSLSLCAQTSPEEAQAAANRAAIDAFYPVMIEAVNNGNFDAARQLCHKAISWEPTEPVHFYNLACIESRAGNVNLGLAALVKSAELGFAEPETLAADGDLANLRSSPVYAKIVAQVQVNYASLGGAPVYSLDPPEPQAQAQARPSAPAPSSGRAPSSAISSGSASSVDPSFSLKLKRVIPPARHKITADGVVGLYSMTRYWSDTGSLEKSVWYFSPDGMAFENPAGGFSKDELAKAERSAKVSGGGGTLTLTWADGKASQGSYKPKPAENSFFWNGGSFTAIPGFKDPLAAAGTWQGGPSNVSRTLELAGDGNFTLTGAAGGITGTWNAEGYALTLTASDGSTKRAVAFPFDGKFYFDGILWSKQN
jgi:hypothetical protein